MNKLLLLLFSGMMVLVAGNSHQKDPTHKRLHQLDIAEESFVTVNLKPDAGVKLPFDTYPKLNEHFAFRLVPATGKPIDIVIASKLVDDEFLDELGQHHASSQHQERKHGLARMREIALKHKSANQGLHAFYRRIHGNWYKLLNLRVPGTLDSGEVDSDAHIVATEKGNLQVFENSGQVGKKYVYELNTRHGK